MVHALYVLDERIYIYIYIYIYTHTHTHTHSEYVTLLFQDNNGYANAP